MIEEQAVIVHLESADPQNKAGCSDEIDTFVESLDATVSALSLGEFDGTDRDFSGNWTIYMYGPDAEKLFKGTEALLRAHPLSHTATVEIRAGGVDQPSRIVRF